MSPKPLAFIWVFIFFLLQNTVQLAFGSSHLPFVLIVVIYYALGEGAVFGMVVGAFAGFLLDLFGVGKIGVQVCELGLVGFLSGSFSPNLFRESLLTQVLLPATMAFFVSLVQAGLLKFYFHEDVSVLSFDLLFVAVISPFIFHFLKKMQGSRQW